MRHQLEEGHVCHLAKVISRKTSSSVLNVRMARVMFPEKVQEGKSCRDQALEDWNSPGEKGLPLSKLSPRTKAAFTFSV